MDIVSFLLGQKVGAAAISNELSEVNAEVDAINGEVIDENKLDYLADTKEAIKDALNAKGLSIADTDTFRSYADKILAVESAEEQSF